MAPHLTAESLQMRYRATSLEKDGFGRRFDVQTNGPSHPYPYEKILPKRKASLLACALAGPFANPDGTKAWREIDSRMSQLAARRCHYENVVIS